MKKVFKLFGVIIGFSFFTAMTFISCASGSSVMEDMGTNISVGRNESLIVIKRNKTFVGSAVAIEILINGKVISSVYNGSQTSFKIPNGNHTIMAVVANDRSIKTAELPFDADSMEITFAAGFLIAGPGLQIIKTNSIALKRTTEQDKARLATSADIEGAVYRSVQSLIGTLPRDTTIAVLNISSTNLNMATIAIDELEFHLVDSRAFKIVDRNTLDKIRSEQNFQMSGDVSDESAVSIGQMIGANIVITGSVTDSAGSRRFTLKALDVKTAEIVTMTREIF
jgi:TolB-like protein